MPETPANPAGVLPDKDETLPWRCSACGYALAGLPAAAVCPECGHPYNRRNGLALFGYAGGSVANVVNMRGGDFARQMLFAGAVASCFFWTSGSRGWEAGSHSFLYACIIFGRLALRVPTWLTASELGTVRVSLSWLGARQEDILPVAAAVRRLALAATVLACAGWAAWVLAQMDFHDGLGVLSAGLIAILVLLAVRTATLIERRTGFFTKLSLTARHGAAAAARSEPTYPWYDIEVVKIEPVRPGWHRLRLRQRDGLLGWDVINAEVQLTEAEATEVRRQIKRWQGAHA